jgi:hypothetical protein
MAPLLKTFLGEITEGWNHARRMRLGTESPTELRLRETLPISENPGCQLMLDVLRDLRGVPTIISGVFVAEKLPALLSFFASFPRSSFE